MFSQQGIDLTSEILVIAAGRAQKCSAFLGGPLPRRVIYGFNPGKGI
jgi:hypothetical protein